MTVTSSVIRPRARLRRLMRGAVAFSIALGLCAASATPAQAADGDTAENAQIDLFVSAGLRGTVAPDSAATASVTLRNGSESTLSAGAATIELSRTPLADGAALAAWLEEGEIDAAFTRVGGDITAPVSAGASATTLITIPQEALDGLAPGVYPLRAELAGAEAEGLDAEATAVEAEAVLVISASPVPPVTVLVPVTASPANGGLLTADELATLTAADGALTAQLDGVSGTSAVLAVDPAIVAAIRVLGAAAPVTAIEWLTRLEELPNERFSLLFGDADATTQVHAGLPALLTPGTLRSYLDPANFPQNTASPSPSPTPADPASALPDDATLSSVPGALPGILWPREDTADADLATLAAYLGGAAATVLSSTSIAERTSGHAARGDHELLITSAEASAALSAAAAEPDAEVREHLLAEATAYATLAAPAAANGRLLVGLDRNESRTADALRAAVTSVDSAGAALTALRAAPATPVTVTATPDATRAEALSTLLADESALTSFSSILTDPALLLTPARIRILRVIDVGTTTRAFPDAVEEHREQTRSTLDAVGIERSSTIQLFGANADLAFWVRNELPWPVNVRIEALPTDTRLDVQRYTDAVAQAASNTRIPVRVAARIGSGDVDVRLNLISPTGVQIGASQNVDVQVRADWETFGLIVFGGLASLLIVLGVVRTVRRRRRDGTDEESAGAADATSDGAAKDGDAAEELSVATAPEEDK